MPDVNAQKIKSVFARNEYNLEDANKQSMGWFNREVRKLGAQKGITPRSLLKDQVTKTSSRVIIGKMYMFIYNAKTADRLPYWDAFPLVFPFDYTDNGFYGINLHYLPYKLRVQLLTKLLTIANNRKMDETTKLKLKYQLLSRYRGAKFCVKRYNTKNVRSPFSEIPANYWATACMLPVEKFKKAGTSEVWSDARNNL